MELAERDDPWTAEDLNARREAWKREDEEFDRRDARMGRWESFFAGIVVGILLLALIQAVGA